MNGNDYFVVWAYKKRWEASFLQYNGGGWFQEEKVKPKVIFTVFCTNPASNSPAYVAH